MILKVSIITAVFNRVETISDALVSVQNQSYKNIEHVIVDGGSTDGTINRIQELLRDNYMFISEPDDGIYDAINKGIKCSTGEIIGILHSDDVYASDSILAQVAMEFLNPNLDAVYADANFFRHGKPNTIFRHYRSDRFSLKNLAWGWMPAHTTIFFRRTVFERFGLYKTNYKIAADIDFVARVFRSENFRSIYVPKVWVKMRIGGISTGGLRNTILLNREVLHALRENGVKTNMVKILSKYPLKLLEFLVGVFPKKHGF